MIFRACFNGGEVPDNSELASGALECREGRLSGCRHGDAVSGIDLPHWRGFSAVYVRFFTSWAPFPYYFV
jgi:hypothetical protein